jgi:GTPase KRas protein
MLVGNKQDKTLEREVSKEEAMALSAYLGFHLAAPGLTRISGRQWNCPFLETSAKTAYNVEKMFNDTIRTLRNARDGDSHPRAKQGAAPTGGGGGAHPERRRKGPRCIIL